MPDASAVEIRCAEESDLSALVELERAALPTPWSQAALVAELTQPSNHLLVAFDSRSEFELVGYLLLRVLDREAELMRIAVWPKLQERRLGTRMLAYAIGRLQELRVRECFLEVREDNVAALSLYAGFGARNAGFRPDYYSDGTGAIILVIEIPVAQPASGSG